MRVFPFTGPSGDPRPEARLSRNGAAESKSFGSQRVLQQNRSEFDILLDFLDTDGNGKVSALELANFIDSLLGTQEHKDPQGSIVFKAVLNAAMRHSSESPSSGAKPHIPGPAAESLMPAPSTAVGPKPSAWSHTGSHISCEDDPGSATKAHGGLAPEPGGVAHGSAGSGDAAGTSDAGTKVIVVAESDAALTEAQRYASVCFLGMEDVRECFGGLLMETDLWLELAGRYSVMTVTLFRQLLLYAGGRLEKRFSLGVFARTYAAFNLLPLWLPFPSLWRDGGPGILQAVYLHQLTKLHQQLGPRLCSRLPMHTVLVVLTMLQFIASYVPLVAFWAAHGIPGLWKTHSVVEFMHASPLSTQLSLFVGVLPWAVLQFLTSSGALKLSCRDFMSLKEQCKAVFLLGDVSSQFEGYPGLTLRSVMDDIKGGVEDALGRSAFRRVNAAMPLLFSVSLELFRRLVRVFLVRNWVADEPLAKVVLPFELWGMFYNIWFAYTEPANCTEYCLLLKKVGATFKALLSKEEALSQGLPWLNNHSPRNLLLWSRMRRYYQSPNCLELRWIEMHLTLVVVAAVAVTIILVVTLVQKTLVKFTPENADLQLFVAWVIPCFTYLVMGLVVDVIMSAATGAQYHDGIMTLSAESVVIADRLELAEELDRAETAEQQQQPERGSRPTGAAGPAAVPHLATAATMPTAGLTRRAARVSEAGPAATPAANWSEYGGSAVSGSGVYGAVVDGGGGRQWRPADHYRLGPEQRARLRKCQDVIRSLVTFIEFNAEYITLFGVPIDTKLRNTLFSVAVTLMGAGVSAFLAIVVKR